MCCTVLRPADKLQLLTSARGKQPQPHVCQASSTVCLEPQAAASKTITVVASLLRQAPRSALSHDPRLHIMCTLMSWCKTHIRLRVR